MIRSQPSGSIVRTVPTPAMPAFAITTSIPPKRSTVPSTAAWSASRSRDVGLEPRGVAAFGGHLLEQLGLEPHEREPRSARGEPAGGLGADAARGAGDQHRLALRGLEPGAMRASLHSPGRKFCARATFGQENRPFTEADLRFPTVLLALLALAVPATAGAAPRVPSAASRSSLTARRPSSAPARRAS